MADDIAFAEDGTMAWTAFQLGKVYPPAQRQDHRGRQRHGRAEPLALFGKDGCSSFSEVFIGDALYEIDLKNARQA